jgi:DNA replicative helicase MCM subunit Mcm2 (Cdc46/Mcm family)
MLKYDKIMIRDAYDVIFKELMNKVMLLLKKKADANIIVTGNPGTGKSRFYLYCIF